MSTNDNTPRNPAPEYITPEVHEKALSFKRKVAAKAVDVKDFVVENPGDTALIVGIVTLAVIGFKLGRTNKALRLAHSDCFDAPAHLLEELALYPDLATVYTTPQGQFELKYLVPDPS